MNVQNFTKQFKFIVNWQNYQTSQFLSTLPFSILSMEGNIKFYCILSYAANG